MIIATHARTNERSRVRDAAALAALFALLAVALAAPAMASQDPGVRLGIHSSANSSTIGVYGRFDIPGPVNLEVSANYWRESHLGGDLETSVIPVRVTAVLNFAPVVSPYLAAGVGLDYVDINFRNELSGTPDDSAVVFEAHAGGGVEVNLGPLSLIADVRYCSVGAVSTDALNAALGHGYDPSGWHTSLSAGIAF